MISEDCWSRRSSLGSLEAKIAAIRDWWADRVRKLKMLHGNGDEWPDLEMISRMLRSNGRNLRVCFFCDCHVSYYKPEGFCRLAVEAGDLIIRQVNESQNQLFLQKNINPIRIILLLVSLWFNRFDGFWIILGLKIFLSTRLWLVMKPKMWMPGWCLWKVAESAAGRVESSCFDLELLDGTSSRLAEVNCFWPWKSCLNLKDSGDVFFQHLKKSICIWRLESLTNFQPAKS